MNPESIARLGLLSFKEGHGSLTPADRAELDLLSTIDETLSNPASARLNDFMTAAYKLGDLKAKGEDI